MRRSVLRPDDNALHRCQHDIHGYGETPGHRRIQSYVADRQ